MEVVFLDQAWDDYLYWQNHDKKILKKINNLLKDIDRDPFKGTGSPEPLKHQLSGYWSRRITLEHRLVYRMEGGQIRVLQCRYHY
ncbi:MAG: Txe/YoeB family addiction module toxin [Bacteroidetes bacterium]|nr:MAG: Txe/YoeB family addiction module toxin [Bacteroidota bacterium]MBL1144064.1 Txe/YoeB family addiction module toxin [Bacteroidota bacterium]NOG56864.1 Txe/YoeB family addiction module toxin [Bacteroidota bacterium]